MNNKEQRVMNDLNHKMSNEIVKIAKEHKANIAFEKLKGIRKTAKVSKNFKYFLNSWQFYTLQSFVEYKSMIEGIKTVFVDPKYTSQICSNCGKINKCESKKYVCGKCNLHIHRDENASYNIANRGIQALNSLEDSTGQLACPDSNPDQSKVKSSKIKVKSKDKSKNGSGRKSRTPRL
jgi:IS605 OrfB family transposase